MKPRLAAGQVLLACRVVTKGGAEGNTPESSSTPGGVTEGVTALLDCCFQQAHQCGKVLSILFLHIHQGPYLLVCFSRATYDGASMVYSKGPCVVPVCAQKMHRIMYTGPALLNV